ncbi:peptidoglycan editing factor PgeF [Stenotrophomonas cyclobalanopsidis]|uniref:Purine nucleoside phosphorylase n=1 Tax=Stenotrophomonas cyclobalanopsidis TaxID=2771362 RepID=A0ABQ6T142_9GAMM|nr:peptidoglycan editing factor PgeF [Stenotrophomonas cyclobalanopsidis]KAA8999109.1 peptidoglycan editing factor PgeF [Stenotrophomonas cyclobalanopsidis]
MDAALPLLQADWPAPAGVRALTTRRHGAGISPAPFAQFNLGNRHAADGDTPANVEHNRQLLLQGLALPSAPHWLRQVHGTTVLRFDAAPVAGASEPVADAAVTSVPGVVLAILTADCLPVVFAAADGREIGAAHAGWRGLADGMLEDTVAAMNTPAAQLRAWLGPAAGPQDYEIGEEVYHAFVGHDPGAEEAFVATREGHWKVDLFALARQRLQAAGLDPLNIHGGTVSTMADPDLYSHRRDRRTGRMATLVWME